MLDARAHRLAYGHIFPGSPRLCQLGGEHDAQGIWRATEALELPLFVMKEKGKSICEQRCEQRFYRATCSPI